MNSRSPGHAKAAETARPVNLVVFMFLILPFGIMAGYLSVTLAFLFSKAGISIEQVAGLVAASLIPQMLKFIWAPLVDITLTVKKWHVLATVISAACILLTGIIPVKTQSLPLLTAIIIISNIAVSFVSIAVNSLSAYDIPEEKKGRVSGFVQAGYMGGTGVGGGVGLWLAQHTGQPWIAAAALAMACLLSCLGLFSVKEPVITVRVKKFSATMNNVLVDVWKTIKTKPGLLALIMVLLPIGTCSAGSLFAAIAKDWHADVGVVALVTGVIGGLVTGVGSLFGGWAGDKVDKRNAYLWFGVFQVFCTLCMVYCLHTRTMFITWTLLYAFSAGMSYAGYNAVTLEAIGKGAAATKFEIYASVSNIPIYVITYIEGVAYTKWGANGLLNIESFTCILAILLFVAIQFFIKRTKSVGVA